MSTPEALITAIKDRIAAGQDKETIKQEALAAGHTEEVFEAAYVQAKATAAMPVSAEVKVVSLPRFRDLFKDSFSYAFKRIGLIGWMFAVGLLSLLAIGVALGVMLLSPVVGAVLMFVFVIAVVAIAFIVGLALQYIVVHDTAETQVSFRIGFAWARKHFFWAGLWVFLLYTLIAQGASTLLLIPYVVIGPFLFFMLFAYVKEGFTGFKAVFRARELGKGNWKGLLFRKVAFWLLATIPMFMLLGIALAYLAIAADPFYLDDPADWLAVAPVLGVLFIVFILYASLVNLAVLRLNALLFQRLAAARPITEMSGTGKDRWKYVVLALIGLIALVFPSDEGAYDDFEGSWNDEFDWSEIEVIEDPAPEIDIENEQPATE